MHHHHHLEPSYTGTVVLDIGADVGALVIYLPAADHQREIEISRTGTGSTRTHSAVRERKLGHGSVYCVVYPSLAAGEYTIWHDETTPAGTVMVIGGEITELDRAEGLSSPAARTEGLSSPAARIEGVSSRATTSLVAES